MKYVGMIQARCGSSRLPNKVLMDLAGKPAIQWVIERAQKSRYLDEVVVLTSINKENIPLVKLCSELGIRVFAGSEDDVLDRYYQFAKLIKPEYIVRITGDCPLYDAALLDWCIEQLEADTDYLGQSSPETFPDGLDVEIIRFEALEKVWREAKLMSEREHVTYGIYTHPELYNLKRVTCPLGDLGKERWTLDERVDYELLSNICCHFGANSGFTTMDVVEYLNSNPLLKTTNNAIIRNEGLKKSVCADGVVINDIRGGVHLRKLTLSDATEHYLAWMNDYEVTRYLESRFYPQDMESIKNYILSVNNASNICFAIIDKVTEQHIGNIKLGGINWIHRFADIGFIIGDKSFWGKGYATEAIRLATKYAFEVLNLRLVYGGAYAPNIGSRKAFEKAGYQCSYIIPKRYQYEGNYIDCHIMECHNCLEEKK